MVGRPPHAFGPSARCCRSPAELGIVDAAAHIYGIVALRLMIRLVKLLSLISHSSRPLPHIPASIPYSLCKAIFPLFLPHVVHMWAMMRERINVGRSLDLYDLGGGGLKSGAAALISRRRMTRKVWGRGVYLYCGRWVLVMGTRQVGRRWRCGLLCSGARIGIDD